jgi:hypothetical protein
MAEEEGKQPVEEVQEQHDFVSRLRNGPGERNHEKINRK